MKHLYTHQQLLSIAKLSQADLKMIDQCRRDYTRLGFAYQLGFVRLANRFPAQRPFEIDDELLTFISVQLDTPSSLIQAYLQRQPTVSEHQERIRIYLQLRRLGDSEMAALKQFLFEEACRLEQTNALMARAEQFLREQRILQPSPDTLRRLVATQRQGARQYIYGRIANDLSLRLKRDLDTLIAVSNSRFSPLQSLKQPPGQASPTSILRLIEKLEMIQATGVLALDLSWLNNNYQRSMTRYVKRCSATRLRELKSSRRYSVLVCFLWQTHRDTIDHIVDMHDKIVTGVYSRAQTEIDEETRRQRKMLRASLTTLRTIGRVLLDETIDDALLREILFSKIGRGTLARQMEEIETWLDGKYSHAFNLVTRRFNYFRRFAPKFLEHLDFRLEEGSRSNLVEAVELLRDMNEENRRKLPEDPPLNFIPRSQRALIEVDGVISKQAWECALLIAVRAEIRSGNVYVARSKRFGCFDDFFISDTRWRSMRESFFRRAGLPESAVDVPGYLTDRLNRVYDQFLEHLPKNTYANVSETGWILSTDATERLDADADRRLDELQEWLSANLRNIKLPDLLIEVDNDLRFTHDFMTPAQQERRMAEDVCLLLATVMAHGCNIGPYTMARLTEGISYDQIKHVTDWQMTEEAQRQVLARLVNAISNLDVT